MRKTFDINTGWDFYLETLESKKKSNYTCANFKLIKNKKAVDLPHDWSIEQSFTKDFSTENESASLPGGIGWYSKKIDKNEICDFCSKSVNLHFGGVYMQSYIYINQIEVASNLYGYNSFDIDISQYIKNGEDLNIDVKVINQLPNSRWYSGSGIYRKVYLEVLEPVHIGVNGIYATTPNLKNTYNSEVNIDIKAKIVNSSSFSENITVKSTLLDKEKSPVSKSAQFYTNLKSEEQMTIPLVLSVNRPDLWSTYEPILYYIRTEVLSNSKVIDSIDTEFGFRWFDYDKERGFLLNSKPLKLQGVCMHHDQGALGANAYVDSIQRQLEIMKEMGINAVRSSHNPISEEFITLCNKMGLLVIEEAFDTWDKSKNEFDFACLFNKKLKGTNLNLANAAKCTWAEFIVKSMVQRDKNAPCVFMWSLGNEVQGKISNSVSKKLSSYAEEIDPYNLGGRKKIFAEDDIRVGIDKKWEKVITGFSANDSDINNITVAGVNYVNDKTFEKVHSDYPNILMLSTESSSALRSREVYKHPFEIADNYNTDTKATENSQMSSYDNEVASWANTAMFDLQYDISLDYVLGEFVWTGFDYLGEPTPFTDASSSFYPTSSYFGIVDTAGFKKDIYYLYQSQWKSPNDTPVLHILPNWNLDKNQLKDGNSLIVVYTNAKAVELRAKKKNSSDTYVSLGINYFDIKTSSALLRKYQVNHNADALYPMALEWSIPYEKYKDYTIYAVALKNECTKEVDKRFENKSVSGRSSIERYGAVKDIKLSNYNYKNDFKISKENYQLQFITIDFLDENKNLVCDGKSKINVEIISGDGEIIGVDNGNSSDTDKNKFLNKNSINAFGGKALVIVKIANNSKTVLSVKTQEIGKTIEVGGIFNVNN